MNARSAVFCSILFLAAPTPAMSFSMLTSDGAWHEKITREALTETLERKSLDALAGKKSEPGAIGAPDLNAPFSDQAHCDNADYFNTSGYPQSEAEAEQKIDACRQYIFAQIENAVLAIEPLVNEGGKVVSSEYPSYISCTFVGDVKGRAKCNVLQYMGKAMHAAQDFYSHTNFVDKPGGCVAGVEDPPGLAREGAAPFLAAPTAPYPAGLVSGCFDKKSAASKLSGDSEETKGCNYSGGMRIKHAFLNKDQPDSPRGAVNGNFERAIAAAVAESKAKWAYFEGRVRAAYPGKRGEVMICAVKTDRAGSCK